MPRKLKLYLTDVHILKVLLVLPDHQVRQEELTRILQVHQDTITRRLKILQRKQLIKTLPDLNHMRTKIVKATTKALRLKDVILSLQTRDITPGRVYFEIDTTKT